MASFKLKPIIHKITLTLLAFLVSLSTSQKLTVHQVDVDDEVLSPPDYGTGGKQWDIIWNISYPAEIKITKFDIDFQAGEFLVICEYPLPADYRLSDGAPAEDALALLPIQNSLLLTSDIIPVPAPADDEDGEDGKDDEMKLLVRINSQYGGFIYFHGISKGTGSGSGSKMEAGVNSSSVSDVSNVSDAKATGKQSEFGIDILSVEVDDVRVVSSPSALTFTGFSMEIQYFDFNPTPVTTTTTERLTTPAPGVDIYLYKHIIGLTPSQFYDGLPQFKEAMAEMGNLYCKTKGIILSREIVSNNVTDDIRLDKDTIFFCDRRNIFYNTCVQIQMAIPIRNKTGGYVFTTPRLEEMWLMYAKKYLAEISTGDDGGATLSPYDPPPEDPVITTWIWVAAILGLIILLIAIAVTSLVTTIFDGRASRADAAVRMITEEENESPSSSQGRHHRSPLAKVIQAIQTGNEEAEYHKMGIIEHDIALSNKDSFNRTHTFNYDNQGYNPDEGYDEYRGGSSGSGSGELKRHPHHHLQIPTISVPQSRSRDAGDGRRTFQAQIHSNAVDSDSDDNVEIFSQVNQRSRGQEQY